MIEAAMNMQQAKNQKLDPRKFNVWLLMVGSIMLFAGLTSAFIVRKAEGDWEMFRLPVQFGYSLIVALLGSLSMFVAFRAAKNDSIRLTQVTLMLTLILGTLFVIFQFLGWQDLAGRGVFFVPEAGAGRGSISGSFVIMLAAVHLAHLVGGLIFVLVVFIKSLMLQVHKKNLLSIDLCNTYWHFVGLLWVYLYLFLYFAPQL